MNTTLASDMAPAGSCVQRVMSENVFVSKTAADCEETALYHYEPFRHEYLLSVLQNGRLHCSIPANLNDPWDCKPAVDPGVSTDLKARRDTAERLNALSQEYLGEKSPFMDYMIVNDDFTFRYALRSITDNLSKLILENWAIYCLSPHPNLTLMWSHYAEHHRGICLEFAVKRGGMFGNAKKVEYFSEYPKWQVHAMEARETTDFFLLSKAKCWEYEHEYRIIGAISTGQFSEHVTPLVKNGFLEFDKNDLRSVIVGCAMAKEDEKKIVSLVSLHAPNVQVKRMRRRPHKYELEL